MREHQIKMLSGLISSFARFKRTGMPTKKDGVKNVHCNLP